MPSFDVVSQINIQEVRNAVEQARKEVTTRFDLKDSGSSVEFLEKENKLVVVGGDKTRLKSVQDIVRERLAKRGISNKSTEWGDPQPAAGDTLRQEVKLKQGLDEEERKRIVKLIKSKDFKVQSQIQGDQVRVSGKKRDDLQAVIAMLKAEVTDLSLQFINFRD